MMFTQIFSKIFQHLQLRRKSSWHDWPKRLEPKSCQMLKQGRKFQIPRPDQVIANGHIACLAALVMASTLPISINTVDQVSSVQMLSKQICQSVTHPSGV